MALVALLKGVNVGGHRRLRPSVLARDLQHLDVVNVGATGAFVVRRRVKHAELRAEIARRLAFDAEVVICRGNEVTDLLSRDFFAGYPCDADIVRFVSVLSRAPTSDPLLPLDLPSHAPWLVRVLARHERFAIGLHRRQMKVIGELGKLEQLFGVPVTTRSWSTMSAIGKVLDRSTSETS